MTLENFGRALVEERPFASDRVSEPGLRHPDVKEIHKGAFERLTQAAREVHTHRVGRGVALLGAAGVGKSHVLARLARWSHEPPQATFVLLHNLLVSPERLPRYMLTAAVGILGSRRAGNYGASALHALWVGAIRRVMRLAPEADISSALAKQGIETLIGAGDLLDRSIRQVLFRTGLHMHLIDAEAKNANPAVVQAGLDWLAGEPIEPAHAQLLALPEGSPLAEGLRDDQDVERVFRVLAGVSQAAGRPLILCVDQFDNLSEAQVAATVRFLHVLVDHVPNLLVVVSGVRANVLALVDRGVITEANWDRVGEEEVGLDLVAPKLAFEIVRSRVEVFRSRFGQVEEVRARVSEDPLFPLSQAEFDVKVGSAVAVRPRQILRWAREAWANEARLCAEKGVAHWLAQWPGGTSPGPDEKLWPKVVDEVVAKALAEHEALRKGNPGSLPPDAGHLEALFRRLLGHAQDLPGSGVEKVVDAPPKARAALVLQSPGPRRTGIGFVVTPTAQVSTVALGKLLNEAPAYDRIVLVSDEERRPIKRTTRAEEYLEKLAELGDRFLHLKLSFADHARLDALVSVVGLAKAGDLEVDWAGGTQALTPADVGASYGRTGRLAKDPVLGALLPKPSAPTALSGPNGPEGPHEASPSSGAPGENGGPKLGGVGSSVARTALDPERSAATLLLALTAVRPEVSLAVATRTYLESYPEAPPHLAQRHLRDAALRLSLAGRVVCRTVEGILRIARVGSWVNALA